jgi:UDP-glucose 4-epimerase
MEEPLIVAKKVIITGGAGFIGSSLAKELVNQGHEVTILDNLSTGKREIIQKLLEKDNVRFVEGSVTDLPLLEKLFQGIEYIFHQAALARVPLSVEHPLATNKVNITGTLNVLIAARDNKVKKVVYASSSSVYGTNPTPQKEGMVPDPLSPYALTKLAGESYCTIFSQLYGLPTVSLRYFNVYGPGQDPESQYAMVIPAFIDRMMRDEPPIIFGDGEQSRDFTYIQDVVHANILAADSDIEGVFNIGSGKNITINALADEIKALLNKNLESEHKEPRPGDAKHTLADITRARKFNYEPKWSLRNGLIETILRLNQGG